MIKRLLTGGTLACVLAAGGCTKDQNEFIADPGTDTVWVSQVTSSDVVTRLADTLSTPAPSSSVNLSTSDTVSSGGLQVYFTPGWQTASGTAASGNATLSAILLQGPGSWIRNFVSTTYGGKPVQANEVMQVSFQSGSTTLQPTGVVFVTFPYNDGGIFEQDSLWGGANAGGVVQWNNPIEYSYLSQDATQISFATPQTGWLLYGMPLADTVNTNAELAVALPNQFTNANSAVFCWLKDYSSVVSLTGNYASRTFIANNLPVGKSATIVALTLTGGLLYMGTKTVTLASGSQLVSVSSTIETLPSVLAYLEQL